MFRFVVSCSMGECGGKWDLEVISFMISVQKRRFIQLLLLSLLREEHIVCIC